MDGRNIKSIWFEFEEWEEMYDEMDENTDVHFELTDGTKWCATFFTYQNLLSISKKNQETGECLSGEYFYAHKPIFISKITRECILRVIENIIREEVDLEVIFIRLEG